ncbi:uncharacterized protein LAESUDRAFT_726975 [Laetiporus sulphureus 93-53]|uniref:Uncharacterized protein n=1 Tax=Laetiporus sulphureus 93-53 TaxID=1314785 RepID=A0A165DPK3_9APHY|nr:uncharacterized protein LAESUDRAFT_726975 [Laetiporus sulphureus 93-53]KZT05341.1 hypothetical protein LAESUDRAFT_726975 [Laetiporus sulphureus 93-53]
MGLQFVDEQLTIAFDWKDAIGLSLLLIHGGVLYLVLKRRSRTSAASVSGAAAPPLSHVASSGKNVPKALRYGPGKPEGGSRDATGPGYLPDPDPLLDLDLSKATVRDYVYVNKVLRYPYFQTMAHQPMHINDWIEIDKDYQWYLDEKARVIREQGKVVIDSLPENDAACNELLETLVDYLPKRFPTLFDAIWLERGAGEKGGSQRTYPIGIVNKVTGERFPDVRDIKGVDALMIVSRLVQDDFLMGREREDGKVYLVGGLIVFPGSYLLSEKIGQPIHQLHADVPQFKKILMSVERTMTRFAPDRPFERASWMIVDDRELFWHNIISGSMPEDMHPKDLYLRIDHQTFRKLPRTRGIMFGVHPVLTKIGDLADSPLVPALLSKIHNEPDNGLMEYKKAEKYTPKLVPYLQELTQQQIARGLIKPEDVEDVAKFREKAGDAGLASADAMV